MARYCSVLLLLAWMMGGALAQPPGNPPVAPPDPPPPARVPAVGWGPAAMEVSPDGVFVLRGGVLAKFDPATMALRGVIDLLAPVEGAPAADVGERLVRRQPPALRAVAHDVYVVAGTVLCQVGAETLAIKQRIPLPTPLGGLASVASESPVITCVGQTLYVRRGDEVSAIDRQAGTVLATTNLASIGAVPMAKTTVLAGTLAERGALGWVLVTEQGEYQLAGASVKPLVAEAAGRQVAVTGLLRLTPGQPVAGTLTIRQYYLFGPKADVKPPAA